MVTSNKKLLVDVVLISSILPIFLKYEVKRWDHWCKVRDRGQNIPILVEKG